MNFHSRSIRFKFVEYDGRNNSRIPSSEASASTIGLRW